MESALWNKRHRFARFPDMSAPSRPGPDIGSDGIAPAARFLEPSCFGQERLGSRALLRILSSGSLPRRCHIRADTEAPSSYWHGACMGRITAGKDVKEEPKGVVAPPPPHRSP